ncbi:type II toxin-antitoxin system RelE/ParE family toxin [bacterium]|nr:type II toxin-antitoxin system RelE/ParE family toxin [bacterium]
MYELLFERSAARQLKLVSDADYKRIIARIKLLADSPRPRGCRKPRGSRTDYRLRIGDWRIVYEVDDERRVVRVFRVTLRKHAYR